MRTSSQTRWNAILGVAVAFGGCGEAAPMPPHLPIATVVPSTAGVPVIAVGAVHGRPGEVALIAQAVTIANRVMASPCFAEKVRKGVYSESHDLDGSAIWAQLSSSLVTLQVVFYDGSFVANRIYGTIGFENYARPDVDFMNRHAVKTAYVAAHNMIHEGEGHSQGLRHDGAHWSSVPSQLDQFFQDCASSVGVTP